MFDHLLKSADLDLKLTLTSPHKNSVDSAVIFCPDMSPGEYCKAPQNYSEVSGVSRKFHSDKSISTVDFAHKACSDSTCMYGIGLYPLKDTYVTLAVTTDYTRNFPMKENEVIMDYVENE